MQQVGGSGLNVGGEERGGQWHESVGGAVCISARRVPEPERTPLRVGSPLAPLPQLHRSAGAPVQVTFTFWGITFSYELGLTSLLMILKAEIKEHTNGTSYGPKRVFGGKLWLTYFCDLGGVRFADAILFEAARQPTDGTGHPTTAIPMQPETPPGTHSAPQARVPAVPWYLGAIQNGAAGRPNGTATGYTHLPASASPRRRGV